MKNKKIVVPRSKPYMPELIKSLEDPAEAAAYLNASMEDGDPRLVYNAFQLVSVALDGYGNFGKHFIIKLRRKNGK